MGSIPKGSLIKERKGKFYDCVMSNVYQRSKSVLVDCGGCCHAEESFFFFFLTSNSVIIKPTNPPCVIAKEGLV